MNVNRLLNSGADYSREDILKFRELIIENIAYPHTDKRTVGSESIFIPECPVIHKYVIVQ